MCCAKRLGHLFIMNKKKITLDTDYSFDIKNCKAESILDTFSKCLVENPRLCKYSLSFGSANICRHPQHLLIVLNTNNKKSENEIK